MYMFLICISQDFVAKIQKKDKLTLYSRLHFYPFGLLDYLDTKSLSIAKTTAIRIYISSKCIIAIYKKLQKIMKS